MMGLSSMPIHILQHGRPHQTLENRTPIQAYQTSIGGGARIVDKFKDQKTCLEVKAKSKAVNYHLKLNTLLS